MAIPDHQTLMLPLLKLVEKNTSIKMKDARTQIADESGLSEQERGMLLPSGKQPIIYNRVGWASTYLKKAGLIRQPQRGPLEINVRAKEALARKPSKIDVGFLKQYPEFLFFKDSEKNEEAPAPAISEGQDAGTPEKILEDAYAELKNQTLSDLLEKIKSCSPPFVDVEHNIDLNTAASYDVKRMDLDYFVE